MDAVTSGIIARMTAVPEKYQDAMDTWIVRQIANGDWAKQDWKVVLGMDTKANGIINWQNALYDPTEVGTISHTAGVGAKGAAASYLNMNFTPNDGVNFLQNDCSIHWYIPTSTTANSLCQFGLIDASGNDMWVRTNNGSGTVSSGLFQTAVENLTGITNSQGHWSLVRTASNAVELFQNGTSVGTYTNASVAMDSQDIYLLARNFNETADLFSTVTDIGYMILGSSAIDHADIRAGYDQFLLDIA